jgi:hypothetical protein
MIIVLGYLVVSIYALSRKLTFVNTVTIIKRHDRAPAGNETIENDVDGSKQSSMHQDCYGLTLRDEILHKREVLGTLES